MMQIQVKIHLTGQKQLAELKEQRSAELEERASLVVAKWYSKLKNRAKANMDHYSQQDKADDYL